MEQLVYAVVKLGENDRLISVVKVFRDREVACKYMLNFALMGNCNPAKGENLKVITTVI